MKSWKKPTPELVARAITGMPFPEQQRYFFDRLENPEWIEPLRKASFFAELPTPERDGNSVRYYLWPASRYLSRMATLKPELVAEIMAAFPATENPFVVQDILVAAASMPAVSAAKLADAVARTAHSGVSVGMDRAGEVATKLGQAGQGDASLKVLNSILEVVPDPRPTTISPSGREYRHQARTLIRGFDYGNILRTHGPELTASLRASYLELLSEKLVFALVQEYPYDRKTRRPVEDYSYIWRPHLEFGDSREEAKQLLISGVVQAAEIMATSGVWSDALQVLQRQPYVVFERIQLFLLAKYPGLDVSIASQKLLNPNLFHDYSLRQEFNDLSRTSYRLLTKEQQGSLLELIDKGVEERRLIERGLSPEQIKRAVRQWRLEHFEPIRDYLSAQRLDEVAELEKEFGKATKYENPVVRGGAVARGGESPATYEELKSMTVDDLVAYLKSWSPGSRTPFGPSHQGLAGELTKAIAANSERYFDRLDDLRALQPIYVRAALQGFQEAARNQSPLAWKHLLALAEWACEQPLDVPTETNESYWDAPDSDWYPTRFAIVDILEDALRKDLLPRSEQNTAWKLIDILANDETECLDYRDSASQEKDVWTYSLNTLRPRAVRAALNYIEWLNKHLKTEDGSNQAVPEIAQFLDRHLDVDVEKSLSVRLIYGEKLPFLCAVMANWFAGAVDRIFPDQPNLQSLRDVAWGAYLAANQAYSDVFRLLERQYRGAIHIGDDTRKMGNSRLLDRPSSMLSHHLAQLYWWGKLDLGQGSVLSEFLATVSESALRSLFIYVGRSLSEAQEPVADEIIARLQLLWDYILASENARKSGKVFANFGWWFNTSYFDDAWALDRLHKSLVLAGGEYEPILDALSRLSRLTEAYPKLVLDCTRMIVLTQPEYVELWTVDLNNILRTILGLGDAELAAETTGLINELGSRGYMTYRALLKPSGA
jgi:hypothetical protein